MIRPLECPICRKPVGGSVSDRPGTFPFCSDRCRQVDLLRWCQGKYAIVEPLAPERLLQEHEKQGGGLLDEE